VYRARDLATRNDGTWRYNEGFLLIYMERFTESLKVYHRIVNTSFVGEENRLVEIYRFNEDFLKAHPEKIQSCFIIGFLKYKKEQNYPVALEYLEKFISKNISQDKYRVLREKAEVYQKEIKKKMDLN